ncbi:MAG TPA: c-type cytochrome [Burkholderiales bacterium]|nr:c-type cytochrome [Burkholderiales bacterium]
MENTAADARNKIGIGLLAAAFAFLVGAIIVALLQEGRSPADPGNPEQVARGKAVYTQHCAACHGAKLEGQPNWQERLPTGRMPAPPHDDSGHTWHHPDGVLFGITKYGLVPGKYAPPKYESDMPAFGAQLADEEIWAVLALIKSAWPDKIRAAQAEISRNAARR